MIRTQERIAAFHATIDSNGSIAGRYDLAYPSSRYRFIDHNGNATTLGYVVWGQVWWSYWDNKHASRRMIAGMSNRGGVR